MSATGENSICMEQMLHGYSGGHRLLSASCSLSKSGERHARMMSDLSGASYKSGFDGYLTGYPLKEDELFAVARTWFAKEQPRPGCVWTHTLLIQFADLGRFEAFDKLLAAFRKPSDDDVKAYSKPVLLPESGGRIQTTEQFDRIKHVVDAVYGYPEEIVAIPSKSSGEHEELMLAIWRQQWPSLRNHFSFCTGALELRVGENRLDVQSIPNEKRLVQKASSKARVVDLNERRDGHKDHAWMIAATRDLLDESDGSLKTFLKVYVDSEHYSRADFQRYSVCFAELTSDKQLTEIVAAVAREFPKKKEARTLKTAIAGPQPQRTFFEKMKDADVLRALLLQKRASSAYDLSSLAVCDRFSTLWTGQEEEAWSLLIEVANRKQSEMVSYLTAAVAEVMSKDSIARMAAERCDLAAEVVKKNISLAGVSEVWRCPELTLSSLSDEFIQQAKLNADSAKRVLAAWVVAGRQDCGKELTDSIGPSIVPLLLSLQPCSLSLMDRQAGEWHAALRNNSDECLAWLRSQGEASAEAACLALLGTNISKDKFDVALLEAWQQAHSRTPDLTRQTLCHAYVIMLCAAFDTTDEQLAESVTRVCFPAVYEAAMQNEVSDRHWDMLQARLPQSGMWWDRCKKLRMGLLEYCVKKNWSVETFIHCTSLGFAFEQVLGSWGLDQIEKAFLGRTIDKVKRGDVDANTDQQRAAERYSYWF